MGEDNLSSFYNEFLQDVQEVYFHHYLYLIYFPSSSTFIPPQMDQNIAQKK